MILRQGNEYKRNYVISDVTVEVLNSWAFFERLGEQLVVKVTSDCKGKVVPMLN
jgi:hypothetical protein